MIYFDTDVLIHYLIKQDPAKNQQAIQHYRDASEKGLFFISLLHLQEASFVLAKLQVDSADIDSMITGLLPHATINYDADHFTRAKELAKKIGFQNTNDCLHTAIAETHCQEIYTYNKSDFKRIQKYTKLKITIL